MAIKSISIQNFTVFSDIKIDFCEGVNVLIGENGTGKTHLLKILHAFCNTKSSYIDIGNERKKEVNEFSHNVEYYFGAHHPEKRKLIRNYDYSDIDIDTDRFATIDIATNNGKREFFIFPMEQDEFGDTGYAYTPFIDSPCAFIPAKDMLTHGGLEWDYAERNLPFDGTLIDVLRRAGVSTLKTLSVEMKCIADKISKIIGGKVLFRPPKYYVEKDGKLIDFNLEAEGFKKLGLVYRLIETGYIQKGSVLLWDEPDANINPKRIPEIVKILLELEQQGVQIFLATHDYNLMKYFSMAKKDHNRVSFYSLYKTNNSVACECEDDYDLLKHNAIVDAEIKLLEDDFVGVV